jgi:hypothetical protein
MMTTKALGLAMVALLAIVPTMSGCAADATDDQDLDEVSDEVDATSDEEAVGVTADAIIETGFEGCRPNDLYVTRPPASQVFARGGVRCPRPYTGRYTLCLQRYSNYANTYQSVECWTVSGAGYSSILVTYSPPRRDTAKYRARLRTPFKTWYTAPKYL